MAKNLDERRLVGCLQVLMERAKADGRAQDVKLIRAALAGDDATWLRTRLGSTTVTPKQMEVLSHIDRMMTGEGVSPTLAEIAEQMGTSKITVYEHVEELIRKGVISKIEKRRHRSLRIIDQGIKDEKDLRRKP
jgi:DNA-binding MarR family transcriptional regulator